MQVFLSATYNHIFLLALAANYAPKNPDRAARIVLATAAVMREMKQRSATAADKNAFAQYLNALAGELPGIALYHVAHLCECGSIVSHAQGSMDEHKPHGGMYDIPLSQEEVHA